MSVQENVLQRGSGLNYQSTKPIASKSHMEVQVHEPIAGIWTVVGIKNYDLITNACVFNADFDLSIYDLVNVRVGDTPNDLATQPSDIGTVVGIEDEIVIVAGIADEAVTVAGIRDEVVLTASMETEIKDVTSEPLRQSIIDGGSNANRAEVAADASEASYQRSLDVEVAVVAQGDVAEDYSGEAEASKLSADSWANAPRATDVIAYTWNPTTDLIEQTPIPNARSSFHWQEIAKLASGGLTYQGLWDVVDCSEPPTPTPSAGELANGYFYIVNSASGDSTGCPNVGVGDWLVWSGDLVGDGTVEGGWGLVNWSFAWNAISDVTVNGLPTANGQDLLPTTGGTMSGNIVMGDGITQAVIQTKTSDNGHAYKMFMRADGSIATLLDYNELTNSFAIQIRDLDGNTILSTITIGSNGNVSTTATAPSEANNFTRKDYVDDFHGLGSELPLDVDFNLFQANRTHHQGHTGGVLTNAPVGLTSNARYILSVAVASTGEQSDLVQIIYGQDQSAQGKMWIRNKQDTTWMTWIEIANASKVLLLSGGTMTGVLNMSAVLAMNDNEDILLRDSSNISKFIISGVDTETYFATYDDAGNWVGQTMAFNRAGGVNFPTAIPRVTPQQGTDVSELTRRDYVDGISIGVNQTWQDVTLSRAVDTDYVNDTGKPIQISVTMQQLGTGSYILLLVDGVSVIDEQGNNTYESRKVISAIIPSGATYRINVTTANILLWSELR